jgi:hypothetical protein
MHDEHVFLGLRYSHFDPLLYFVQKTCAKKVNLRQSIFLTQITTFGAGLEFFTQTVEAMRPRTRR